MHFGVILLLLVREKQDFHVRIRGATGVHGNEVRGLKDANCELLRYVGVKRGFYSLMNATNVVLPFTSSVIGEMETSAARTTTNFGLKCCMSPYREEDPYTLSVG